MLVSESILENLGTRLISDLRTAQSDRGLTASGRSAKSLSFQVQRNGALVTLTITGASYWRFQQNGRRANQRKGRPSTWFVNVIREWIKVKNLSIPLTAAGAIAYKITNEGITVPNGFNRGGVLSEPLNAGRIVSLLKVDLAGKYASAIRSELFKQAA